MCAAPCWQTTAAFPSVCINFYCRTSFHVVIWCFVQDLLHFSSHELISMSLLLYISLMITGLDPDCQFPTRFLRFHLHDHWHFLPGLLHWLHVADLSDDSGGEVPRVHLLVVGGSSQDLHLSFLLDHDLELGYWSFFCWLLGGYSQNAVSSLPLTIYSCFFFLQIALATRVLTSTVCYYRLGPHHKLSSKNALGPCPKNTDLRSTCHMYCMLMSDVYSWLSASRYVYHKSMTSTKPPKIFAFWCSKSSGHFERSFL